VRIKTSQIASWTRRNFVRAGLAAAGVAALGAYARPVTATAAGSVDPAVGLDDLARGVRGRMLRSSSPGYDEARKVWNKAYDHRPLAMVRAADVDDVRRCVEFARTHAVPIAIRGGGHSYAGYGVAESALQIDLGALTAVSVDREGKTAVVGGGARIRDLLSATLPHGLYTPMGACGAVGVAGLTLAGGDTNGRGLYGTACDNLIGAQLVTADGDVLELGPGRNDDLYWAIRGGGGNFGVVTRLDFRLHPVVPLHTVAFDFGWLDARSLAGLLRTFGDLVREAPDAARAGFYMDPVSGASASCGFRGDAAVAAAYLEKWQKAFRPTVAQMSISTPDPDGEVWNTTHLAVDGAFIEDLSGGVVDEIARAIVAGRGVGQMLFGLSNGVAARVPMDATAYPLRGTGLSSLVAAEWDKPELRARAEQWVAETGAALQPYARRAYVNYLPPGTPERIRDVYGSNYPRLARIKAQYDPENLFRSNQNIQPGSRG
jgi:FAD/FMN-containing dehydrogenase